MDKKTILIIDDAPEVTKILRFHLEKKYVVLEAHDGEEGLKLTESSHPDLIILDINMPRMGGIAFYHKISSSHGKPRFSVIVLTVREELGTLFKDLDVDGFITKPFNIEYVLQEVDIVMIKRYGQPNQSQEKIHVPGPKKVLVADDNEASFNKIVVTLLNAGYMVNSARSGMGAIEKLMSDLPDIMLIKLGLPDISGDLVCVKLKQMPRTCDIPFLLYTEKENILDRAVVKKICEIIKAELIETDDPEALLVALEKKIKA